MEVPLVVVVLVGVSYVAAAVRRGKAANARPGGTTRTIEVAAEPAAVFAALQGPFDRYKVDDVDPANLVVVLSVPPGIVSWGFFFPIWIKPAADGGSVVEIGIQSRLFQWGPIVTHAHARCASAVEALLSPPTARVVT